MNPNSCSFLAINIPESPSLKPWAFPDSVIDRLNCRFAEMGLARENLVIVDRNFRKELYLGYPSSSLIATYSGGGCKILFDFAGKRYQTDCLFIYGGNNNGFWNKIMGEIAEVIGPPEDRMRCQVL